MKKFKIIFKILPLFLAIVCFSAFPGMVSATTFSPPTNVPSSCGMLSGNPLINFEGPPNSDGVLYGFDNIAWGFQQPYPSNLDIHLSWDGNALLTAVVTINPDSNGYNTCILTGTDYYSAPTLSGGHYTGNEKGFAWQVSDSDYTNHGNKNVYYTARNVAPAINSSTPIIITNNHCDNTASTSGCDGTSSHTFTYTLSPAELAGGVNYALCFNTQNGYGTSGGSTIAYCSNSVYIPVYTPPPVPTGTVTATLPSSSACNLVGNAIQVNYTYANTIGPKLVGATEGLYADSFKNPALKTLSPTTNGSGSYSDTSFKQYAPVPGIGNLGTAGYYQVSYAVADTNFTPPFNASGACTIYYKEPTFLGNGSVVTFYTTSQTSNPPASGTLTCNSSTDYSITLGYSYQNNGNNVSMYDNNSEYTSPVYWALASSPGTMTTGALAPSSTYTYSLLGGYNNYNTVDTSNSATLASRSCTTQAAPFNYSLSTNGGEGAVMPGSTVTGTITETLLSGTTQAVTLSASGLPAGVTGVSFSPTSANPTHDVTISITTSNSITPGTYSITVTGSPMAKIHTDSTAVAPTTTFTFTIQAPPPPTQSTAGDDVTLIPLSVSCAAYNSSGSVITSATTGQTVVWKAVAQGGDGTFSYVWSGDNLAGTALQNTYTNVYGTTGTKNMSVTDTSDGVSATASCNNSITITNPLPQPVTPSPITGGSCGGSINLTYSANTGATSYKLYRNTADTTPYTQVGGTYTYATLPSQDSGSPGALYYYQLETINAAGSSFSSRPISTAASPACFNYNLSNSGNISVVAGQSSSNTITETLVSGATQTVGLSPKSLPDGVTMTFSPSSQNPPGAITATLKTAAGVTIPGVYSIEVDGSLLGKSTTFILTVLPASVTPSAGTGSCGGNINLSYSVASTGATSYKLYRNTSDTSPYTQIGGSYTYSQLPTLDTGTLGTTYYYQVETIASSGSSFSNRPVSAAASSACFNYSLSNSGNISVVAGQAVTDTITKTLLAGTTQPVTLSILTSGGSPVLPNGVTATFDNNPSNPTSHSTLTLATTLGTTLPNTYLIEVDGSSLGKSTTFNLTVTNPSYNLTITKTGSGTGSVTCGGTCASSYAYNTSVTLRGQADAGSTFVGWSGDVPSSCVNNPANCTVTMSAAKNITATFTQQNAFIDTFTATTPVTYGTGSALTWTSSNMQDKSCSISSDKTVSGLPTKSNLDSSGTYTTQGLTQDPTTFTVTCVKNTGTSGSNTKSVTVNILPQAVAVTPSAGASCGGSMNLSYSGGSNATSYELNRNPYSTAGSGWGVIANGTLLSTLPTSQSSLTPATSYSYQVKSINSSGNAYGAIASNASSADCTLTASLTASPSSGTAPLNNVTLTATAGGTATGSLSYRFMCQATDPWSSSQSSNTYSCNYAVLGPYSPQVEITRGGKTANATASVTVSATPSVDLKVDGGSGPVDTSSGAPLAVANGANVNLTWTSASISTGNKPCTVDWYTTGNGKRDATNTTGENKTVAGLANTYTISCTTVNNTTVSDSVYVNTLPISPTLTATTASGNNSCGGKINLSYGGGSGATSYKLYRNTSDTSPYTQIAASELAQDTGTPGTTYYYQLESINNAGSSFSNRPVSAVASAACTIAPTVDLKIGGSDGPTTINFNDSPTISWTTTNDPVLPTSCSASGSNEWSGGKSPSPNPQPPVTAQNQVLGAQNCTTPRTYSITCSNSVGNATDNVIVNIDPSSIPHSVFNAQASPTSGIMNFYAARATSNQILVTVTSADDQCGLDAGTSVTLNFSFKDSNGNVVANSSVSPTTAVLTPAQFATGVSVQVTATTPLDPNKTYTVVVNPVRNGKSGPVLNIPIQVLISNPTFKEF